MHGESVIEVGVSEVDVDEVNVMQVVARQDNVLKVCTS